MSADVAHELRRAAAVLEAQALTRAQLAAAATATWHGARRTAFDAEHRRLVAQAAALTDACRRAAAGAAAGDGQPLTRWGRFS